MARYNAEMTFSILKEPRGKERKREERRGERTGSQFCFYDIILAIVIVTVFVSSSFCFPVVRIQLSWRK
jgi:hypothetical protein